MAAILGLEAQGLRPRREGIGASRLAVRGDRLVGDNRHFLDDEGLVDISQGDGVLALFEGKEQGLRVLAPLVGQALDAANVQLLLIGAHVVPQAVAHGVGGVLPFPLEGEDALLGIGLLAVDENLPLGGYGGARLGAVGHFDVIGPGRGHFHRPGQGGRAFIGIDTARFAYGGLLPFPGGIALPRGGGAHAGGADGIAALDLGVIGQRILRDAAGAVRPHPGRPGSGPPPRPTGRSPGPAGRPPAAGRRLFDMQ